MQRRQFHQVLGAVFAGSSLLGASSVGAQGNRVQLRAGDQKGGLKALLDAGVERAVINTAWLGGQISGYFSSVFASKRRKNMPEQLSY